MICKNYCSPSLKQVLAPFHSQKKIPPAPLCCADWYRSFWRTLFFTVWGVQPWHIVLTSMYFLEDRARAVTTIMQRESLTLDFVFINDEGIARQYHSHCRRGGSLSVFIFLKNSYKLQFGKRRTRNCTREGTENSPFFWWGGGVSVISPWTSL